MRHRLTACLLVLLVASAAAAPLQLISPDGRLAFQVFTNDARQLHYTLTANGRLRLEAARLGITVDGVDLGANVSLAEARSRHIAETFPWRGPRAVATNRCVAYEIPVRAATGAVWTLEVRVFNDGAGFRYRVPGSGRRTIRGESTAWQLPGTATVWFQTETGAAAYEGVYQAARADRLPLQKEVRERRLPAYFGPPVTVVYADGGFGLISEAALFNYSGMSLRPEGESRLRAAFADDLAGWQHEGEILSPWRVFLCTEDLNGLVQSDVIPALCEPPDPQLFPEGMRTGWLKPGKAPCTWMVYGNDGAQWERQKWFVDVAAATGCEYLLVDAGWRSARWGWLKDGGDVWARAAELCRYAAERNVGIFLWHAFPEGREDSPGLSSVEAREELFQRCQQAGVKGVKIDFFNSESRATIVACEDLLRRAARHQLMVDLHGVHKPTGEARTWPNEMTREGIREQEFVLWDVLPLEHYGALPFTRLVAGHADFLPGYLQRRFLKNTTQAFQMASVVVFSSPFLCWPDNPEAYLNSPLLQFVRTVPVTWDETRVLPGSVIGETVLLARRRGAEWYVAVLNCRSEPRTLEVDLSFAGGEGKELTLYRDGASPAGCRIETGVPAPANGRLRIELQPGGGCLAHLAAPRTYSGW